MLRALTIAAVLLAAACTRPAVTASGPDSVTIRYDPALYGRQEISARARQQCAAFGKAEARFVTSSAASPIPGGFRYDTYACEGETP